MRFVSTRIAAGLCGGLVLAMSVPAGAAVDAKLLEMLKANGSITPAQYSELKTELNRDMQALSLIHICRCRRNHIPLSF
ncbi:hypothetical protein GIW54_20735, partial [Pseudomonas proteolytica]|nr:hypothetical protein [Pseudomonas proteolytica]